MRRTIALLVLGAGLLGCGDGPTESAPDVTPTMEQVLGTFSRASTTVLFPDFLRRAPDSLRLTADQERRIRAASEAFVVETAPQMAALQRLLESLLVGDPAAVSPEQRRAFVREATPLIRTFNEAFERHQRALASILTSAQRAWLEERMRDLVPPFPHTPTP
jgi:hypothetical protein